MTLDLETRLRRAAEHLDEVVTARMTERPTVIDLARPPTPRRRWIAAAAAVALLIAGTATVIALAGDEEESPGTVPPSSPTTKAPTTSAPVAHPAFFHEGWNKLPRAPIGPRIQHHTIATEDGVLVWGGWRVLDKSPNGGLSLQSLRNGAFFDMRTGNWRRTPDAPVAAEGGDEVAVAVGSQVIFMTEADTELATFAYHADTNSWETLPSPPAGIWPGPLSLAPFALDDKAYFVQAPRAADEEVELRPAAIAIYDTGTRTWSMGSTPPDDLAIVWGTAAGQELIVSAVYELPQASTCPTKTYAYSPSEDEWTLVSTSDDATTIAALTWTGDSLFTAAPEACPYRRDDFEPRGWISPRPMAGAQVFDVAAGTADHVDAPQLAVSTVGAWTGSAVTYIAANGLPVFYNPSTEQWHDAPPPGRAGFDVDAQQATERARFVWSHGAVVTWGGTKTDAETAPDSDDVLAAGWAYVPPPAFGG